MRRKIFFSIPLTFIALGTLLFTGCKKENQVKACFEIYQNNLPKELVSFESCSENATSYHWDFGDGNTSSSPNPEHIYQTAGPKTITLTVYGDSKEDSYSKTINVTAIPPRRLNINKITITHWNNTFNNLPWDTDGFADLTTKITDDDRYLYLSSVVHNNCELGTPYSFEASSGLPLRLTDMDQTVYVEWYDQDDGLSSQFMGSVGFTPAQAHVFGENILQFDQNGFQFEMEVTWEY